MKLIGSAVVSALIVLAATAPVAQADDHGVMIALDEVEWTPIEGVPGAALAVLWGDPYAGASVRLVKSQPGSALPRHIHTGDYHAVNLSGTWRHAPDNGEGRDLPPGSYVFQPGGETHTDACVGTEECIVLIQQSEPADYIPVE